MKCPASSGIPLCARTIDLKVPHRFFSKKVDEAALVLEWIDGSGLDENPPADVRTLLGIFMHCASGLASMHKLKSFIVILSRTT